MGNLITVPIPSFENQINVNYTSNFWGAIAFRKDETRYIDVFCVDKRVSHIVHQYLLFYYNHDDIAIVNYMITDHSRNHQTVEHRYEKGKSKTHIMITNTQEHYILNDVIIPKIKEMIEIKKIILN
jgi:hypothetical protein